VNRSRCERTNDIDDDDHEQQQQQQQTKDDKHLEERTTLHAARPLRLWKQRCSPMSRSHCCSFYCWFVVSLRNRKQQKETEYLPTGVVEQRERQMVVRKILKTT
jgi:hypothetical protein